MTSLQNQHYPPGISVFAIIYLFFINRSHALSINSKHVTELRTNETHTGEIGKIVNFPVSINKINFSRKLQTFYGFLIIK